MLIKVFFDLYISKKYNKKYHICKDIECYTRASCNYKNETKLLYCSKHKLKDMNNITIKKCIICKIKIPNYNYENENKALYCKECKKENMVDIKNKKCIECNKKQPNYNYKNENKALYCNDCKDENMVDIKNKKCIECRIKQPCYNYENETELLYCNDCKKENMINIKDKKCINCKIKIPTFNYGNVKEATYCGNCRLQNMVNIKNKKCIKCNLTLANRKYKNHCVRCFIQYFKDEPIVRNYKIKEKHMVDYIKEEFKGLDLKFDKTLLCGCSKRRPDIFIDLFNYTIVIECDENQHKSKEYEEEEREWDIYDDLAKRPIVFIRFNPDSYKDENNKKINSCFKICKQTGIQIIANKKEFTKRLTKLKETIQFHLENKPKKNINIIKLFYDNF
jgi:hypothetical protein